ncbi:MAG: diacylglycerol kinase [Planctomycetota bacterium]
MEQHSDRSSTDSRENPSPPSQNSPERPSKRYTLTAYSDAYRLDREDLNQPTAEQWAQKLATQQDYPAPKQELLDELSLPMLEPLSKADRRGGTIGKSWAGLNGLKLAIRGDSSFFAHAYRFTIVLMFGVMLQLAPIAWLLLALCAALVLMAELYNSAIDTIVRSPGHDPEHAQAACDIGSACVLVSVTISAAVTIALFALRLKEIFTE